MPRTIYLRVGTEDRISLYSLIDSLRTFLYTLQDIDATISHDQRGSLDWEVVSLEKNSPPLVGVSPYQKTFFKQRGYPDFSEVVTEQFVENSRLLSSRGERNKYLSDSALSKIKKLAAKTARLGPMAVYISNNGKPEEDTEAATLITAETLTNVKKLTEPKYSAYGSIIGNLEQINVHHSYEFKVWDEASHKPITCKFDKSILGNVKELLEERVLVSGTLLSNSAGNPISIMVEDLEPLGRRNLPTIKQMSGLVKNFTGGLTLKEYMEELSDE